MSEIEPQQAPLNPDRAREVLAQRLSEAAESIPQMRMIVPMLRMKITHLKDDQVFEIVDAIESMLDDMYVIEPEHTGEIAQA